MDESARNASDGFPLIEVRGTAYEMGWQHGAQVPHLVGHYLNLIERDTGLCRDVLCRNAMNFLPGLQALSPAFVGEVRGLADGAGISFEEALLCQVRGEARHTWQLGCTAFALRGQATVDGNSLVGQNQDLPREYSDVSILLRVLPDDGRPRALIYTFAGQLGYFGMNEYGVANYANAVGDYVWRPGFAHYPLKRVILERRTVQECVQLLRNHAACSAANIILCDGQGTIASVECRPEGIALYGGEHPDVIVHTNHYLTLDFSNHQAGALQDSFARYQRMLTLVHQHWGRLAVEDLKEILADHAGDPAGICRHGATGMETTSGHIAEPQRGLVHIRRGYGCAGKWHTYPV